MAVSNAPSSPPIVWAPLCSASPPLPNRTGSDGGSRTDAALLKGALECGKDPCPGPAVRARLAHGPTLLLLLLPHRAGREQGCRAGQADGRGTASRAPPETDPGVPLGGGEWSPGPAEGSVRVALAPTADPGLVLLARGGSEGADLGARTLGCTEHPSRHLYPCQP